MPFFYGQKALRVFVCTWFLSIVPVYGQAPLRPSDQFPPTPEGRLQPGTPASADDSSIPQLYEEPRRIAGIFPNFGTQRVDQPYSPITAKQKFRLAFLNATSPSNVLLPAINAGIGMASGGQSSFGQGAGGYFSRFGANVGDGLIGNFYVNGVFASVLHQDPRFFSKRTGSFGSRLGWAMRQAIISRWDDGRYRLNVAELAGTAMAAATSMAYRPDDRSAGSAAQVWGTRIASDSIGNIVNEFAPEIGALFGRKKRP